MKNPNRPDEGAEILPFVHPDEVEASFTENDAALRLQSARFLDELIAEFSGEKDNEAVGIFEAHAARHHEKVRQLIEEEQQFGKLSGR
jgi:hypothetical protein